MDKYIQCISQIFNFLFSNEVKLVIWSVFWESLLIVIIHRAYLCVEGLNAFGAERVYNLGA